MKLFCMIIGSSGSPFSVTMNSPEDTIDDLKKSIRLEKMNDLAHIDADKFELFLAHKDGAWLTSFDAKRARKTDSSLDDSWLENELDSTDLIEDFFNGDLSKRVVHVLVKLPGDEEAKMILATVQKQRVIEQIRKKTEEEELMAAAEMEENRRLAEHIESIPMDEIRRMTEHIAGIPPKRKRDWVLNEALEPKVGKDGNAAFSAVEYESLLKRFRTDELLLGQREYQEKKLQLMQERELGLDRLDTERNELAQELEVKREKLLVDL